MTQEEDDKNDEDEDDRDDIEDRGDAIRFEEFRSDVEDNLREGAQVEQNTRKQWGARIE